MIISTSGRTTDELNKKAQEIAGYLGVRYIPRHKKSVQSLHKQFQEDVLIVGKGRIELFVLGSAEPFFFHPSSASFRVKRLIRGEKDPFVEAAKLQQGMSLLDCTLGLASDSITASFAVGAEGEVAGIEGNPFLSFITSNGLKEWDSGLPELDDAMRRIKVCSGLYEEVLANLPDASFDIVYFDPMFETAISESDGIRQLRHLAVYTDLSEAAVEQALRVAKHRVILKDHFRSPRFKRFGFKQQIRKNSLFHYGAIECTP